MALAATVVHEVRTTGSDTNGGYFDPGVGSPGTDYSVQDAAQVSYTDLVIGATNTQLTSAAHPFTSAHVGNGLNVTGGAGFTTGWYTVASVSGSTATMDRAVGTANSTAGTGNLGGGFATPGQAMSIAVASNTIYIKQGTYTCSTSNNVAGGRMDITVGGSSANTPFQVVGYNTNRTLTNSDTPPQIEAGASFDGATSQLVFLNSNYIRVRNLKLRNSNSRAGGNTSTMCHMNGVYNLCERVDVDANSKSGWYGFFQGGTECHCYDCIAQHCTAAGFSGGGSNCSFHFCYAANNSNHGFIGVTQYLRCISYNNSGATSDGFNMLNSPGVNCVGCVAASNGRNGFLGYYDTKYDNCIAYGNSNDGFHDGTGSNNPIVTLYNCAGGGNGGSNVSGTIPSYCQYGFATLTASPFTNAGNGDFSLNNTASAGAACRAAGYPSSFYGLSTNSYTDIGAAQHQDAGGGPSTVAIDNQTTIVWPDTGCIGY